MFQLITHKVIYNIPLAYNLILVSKLRLRTNLKLILSPFVFCCNDYIKANAR